ncbi:MAG TPA: hypothetical protein VGC44_02675 [Longimicrobiales bacterium]
MRSLISISAGVLLAACSATPPGAPPAPTGVTLRYAATAPATVTYQFADSSGFNIRGGAIGEINVTARGTGTADATLAPKGTDVELRIKITDLVGSFTNSAMGGTINATESDVTGEAVLTLSPRGVMTIGQLPTTTRNAQGVGMGAGFFRRFTVRLPAGPIQRGATWTDTVTASDDNSGVKSTVNDVVTSTWARDTVVAGRTLNVLTHSTQRTMEISGSSEGVQIAQKLSGTATGYTLWDAQRSLIVERYENTDLSGTFDLPAMGVSGLPVTAKGFGRITLR